MAVDQDNGQVDQTVPENYENLLDDYSHFAPPAADEVLQGTVLSITAKDVIVDFGYKSEGIVPIEQFQILASSVEHIRAPASTNLGRCQTNFVRLVVVTGGKEARSVSACLDGDGQTSDSLKRFGNALASYVR